MRTYLILIFFSILFFSCANDLNEVNALTSEQSISMENGNGISILYSDSAILKVKITADSIVRYLDKSDPRDVFPSGIFIEFLSESGKPTSWMEADRATRREKANTFVASGNVRFYNKKDETLISTELTWDENKSILYTEKFVTIIQPEKGDTTYGFGFESNEEFNIFEIKRWTSAIFNSDEFKNKFKD